MRIVGAPWFDLSFLKERQLFAKEEILRGKSVAGTGREETSPPQVEQWHGCREETMLNSGHDECGDEHSGSHVTRRYDSVIRTPLGVFADDRRAPPFRVRCRPAAARFARLRRACDP